ncbi:MAG TPA: hypothetical protein RMG48_05020 [Myxococcales bacterium LLY-WYZ-16_1]|nr:hypothetical protein [Myxococcales bacterium LLY-WYZ-16_1]
MLVIGVRQPDGCDMSVASAVDDAVVERPLEVTSETRGLVFGHLEGLPEHVLDLIEDVIAHVGSHEPRLGNAEEEVTNGCRDQHVRVIEDREACHQ